MDDGFDRALKLAGRRHDIVAIVVEDDAEKKLPALGLLEIQDAETGEVVEIDTSSRAFRKHYEARYKQMAASARRAAHEKSN